MSGIFQIQRDWGFEPAIVRIATTDTLATITTTGYLLTQTAQIQAANAGAFDWTTTTSGLYTDYVLVYYSDNGGSWGFFNYVPSTGSLVAAPTVPGSLANTLPNTHVFVGNASNVATGVALSGAATISNTGVLTLGSNIVDYTNIALDVAATATVALTAAQFNAMYATPVLLLAAPGSGKSILIDSMIFDIAFNSAAWANGGVVGAQYDNTDHLGGVVASGTVNASVFTSIATNLYVSCVGSTGLLNGDPATIANTAVYLSNATAPFITGNSTMNVVIKYRVVTLP
jgi:hypothetical protein